MQVLDIRSTVLYQCSRVRFPLVGLCVIFHPGRSGSDSLPLTCPGHDYAPSVRMLPSLYWSHLLSLLLPSGVNRFCVLFYQTYWLLAKPWSDFRSGGSRADDSPR